jgi:hypothetical protein
MLGLRRRTAEDQARAQAVKDLVRAALGAPPDLALTVNEIICADPACPGTETVILIMRPGEKTRAMKIARPMAEVTADDVLSALAAG